MTDLTESYSGSFGLNFEETELSLSLPGKRSANNSSRKRGFQESVDLTLGGNSTSAGDCHSKTSNDKNEISSNTSKPPATKAQVVGWPPVKSTRKNIMMKSRKLVKVAMDGAPYLRKVDLEMYSSYQQLLSALENMFSCLGSICKVVKEKKLVDTANGVEYVPTYEDKDGDWMLVGDVPWNMFVESCKRIRLMKSSEEIGLATNCSSTNSLIK